MSKEQEALRAKEIELREQQMKLAASAAKLVWTFEAECRRRLKMFDDVIAGSNCLVVEDMKRLRSKQASSSPAMAKALLQGQEPTNRALGVVFDIDAVIALAGESNDEESMHVAMLGLVRFVDPYMTGATPVGMEDA